MVIEIIITINEKWRVYTVRTHQTFKIRLIEVKIPNE